MLHYIVFLICAYLMGCMAAIPSGPVQIEVVRRSLNGQLMPSIAVVSGAFIIDVAYGHVALFGISPFLSEEKVMAVFWLFGGLLLGVLGVIIIRKTLKRDDIGLAEGWITRKRWGFITGLSVSVINPVMIIWWLSGVRLFKDAGLITELTSETALFFIYAGSLGLASYLTVLSLVIFWAKKFISQKRVRQINIVFGYMLLLLAVYFICTSAVSFLNRVTG